MALLVYVLCALTSAACAVLLLRGYAKTRVDLLRWGGLCFVGLALNHLLLVIDVRMVPEADLSVSRTVPALVGVAWQWCARAWTSLGPFSFASSP